MANNVFIAFYILALVGMTLAIVGGLAYVISAVCVAVGRRFLPSKYLRFGWMVGPIVLIYGGYRALYPSDSFYLGEFEEITEIKDVSGVNVIYGSASYPIVHGDYCSAALLQTNEIKFDEIYQSLIRNPRRSDSISFGCDELSRVVKKTGFKEARILIRGAKIRNDYFFIEIFPGYKMLAVKCNS